MEKEEKLGQEVKKVSKIHQKDVLKELKHEFSEEELKGLMIEMAQQEIRRNELKDSLKNIAADFRSRIQDAEKVIRDDARKISNGFEYRTTECRQIMDYFNGIVSIIRKDLDEVVEERPMTAAEKQVPLL